MYKHKNRRWILICILMLMLATTVPTVALEDETAPLVIEGEESITAVVGEEVDYSFKVKNPDSTGEHDYEWSTVGTPPGLYFASDGITARLVQTPTAAGEYIMVLTVTDQNNPSLKGTKTLPITVLSPLSVSDEKVDFGEGFEHEYESSVRYVTVTNNSSEAMDLKLSPLKWFTASLESTTLGSGKTTILTCRNNEGLTSRRYYENLTLTGVNDALDETNTKMTLQFIATERAGAIGGCMIVDLFGENAEETAALRDFRDSKLEATDLGRFVEDAYYTLSPTAIWILNNVIPEAKPIVALSIKGLVKVFN